MIDRPLSREDRAILELESATVAGHTCKVLRLGAGAPSLDELRARVNARIHLAPPLTWRLAGRAEAPVWRPVARFRAADHVVAAVSPGPVNRAGLRRVVAHLFERRLERDRPLWQLHRVPTDDGGAALVWRVHHALADGTATMRFARLVLFDHDEPVAPPRAHAEHREDEARRREHLGALLRRELVRGPEASPFDGRIGSRREVAFASFALAPLHDAARELAGATVNDAVVAVVGGGLRRWLEAHGRTPATVRVRIPVSLHEPGDTEGNRDGFFSVGVALGERDPVARLREVHAETTACKAGHDAARLDAFHRELAARPQFGRLVEHLEDDPRRFALSVSNVPGPREPVTVLETPVTAMHSLAEIGERHALRVTVVSLAGRLHFGVCVDPAIVPDPDLLAAGMEAEAAALASSVAPTPRPGASSSPASA